MDSRRDTPQCRHCGVGCPIRRSRDHRALAPPPSFSQRATSFIASRCQGIHQMPLSCSPTPSPKAALRAAGERNQRTEIRPDRSACPLPAVLKPCVGSPLPGPRAPAYDAYPCPGTTDPPHKGPKVPAAHPVMPASRSRLASRCQNVHRRPALRRAADLLLRARQADASPLARNPRLVGGPGPI
jgi:hypothetical protein